jgi:hypothetical protein
MNNVFLTPAGHLYTQLPNGLFTDGDVKVSYLDMHGVLWEAFNGFYCADGDGMVTVQPVGDHFIVAEQGDTVSVHHTLRDALIAAQAILATDYTAVYENHVGEA